MTAAQTCITCGYSLAGLAESGVCPECARPIADSLRDMPFLQLTDRQASSLEGSLRLIEAGLVWSLVGVGCCVLGVAIWPLAIWPLAIGGVAFLLIGVVLWNVGWVRVGIFAPRATPDAGYLCRRALCVAACAQALGTATFPFTAVMGTEEGALVIAAACVAGFGGCVLGGTARLRALVGAHATEATRRGARLALVLVSITLAVAAGGVVLLICDVWQGGVALSTLVLPIGLAGMGWFWFFLLDVRRLAGKRLGKAERRV